MTRSRVTSARRVAFAAATPLGRSAAGLSDSERRVVRTVAGLDAAVLLLHLALGGPGGVVDLTGGGGLAAWWSGALMIGVSLSALAVLLATSPSRPRGHWGIVTIGFLGLSLEEVVGVHARVGEELAARFDSGSPLAIGWPVAYAPLLVVGAMALWRASRELRGRVRSLALGGLFALAISVAIGLSGGGSPTRGEAFVGEILEVGGLSLLLLALLATARGRLVVVRRDAVLGGEPRHP